MAKWSIKGDCRTSKGNSSSGAGIGREWNESTTAGMPKRIVDQAQNGSTSNFHVSGGGLPQNDTVTFGRALYPEKGITKEMHPKHKPFAGPSR